MKTNPFPPKCALPDSKKDSLLSKKVYESVRKGSGKQEVATTMAFVRLLKDLMRDKAFAPRVVPIIPDEARTFGIDAFFPTIKIYNPGGQKYTPVDADLFLSNDLDFPFFTYLLFAHTTYFLIIRPRIPFLKPQALASS